MLLIFLVDDQAFFLMQFLYLDTRGYNIHQEDNGLKSIFLSDPMFVGRDHELDVLSNYLDSAFVGNGKTIFVSGEAGSGKTRLINEFLSQAQKKKINLITGWCLSNATIPYFP